MVCIDGFKKYVESVFPIKGNAFFYIRYEIKKLKQESRYLSGNWID